MAARKQKILLGRNADVFDNLPAGVRTPQPKPMEAFGQNHGFILYRTKLVGRHSGQLALWELHDYANIFVDGKYLGTLNRAKKEIAIVIPKTDPSAHTLDILVEGMGRINFSQYLIDRKGITDRVTLDGMTLMNWEVVCLPIDEKYLAGLKFGPTTTLRPGQFFQGTFNLEALGDTYLDLGGWKKSVVWVNGNNLGRYWEIGPQKRLYCPASFLREGRNEIVVFDLHRMAPAPVRGTKTLE